MKLTNDELLMLSCYKLAGADGVYKPEEKFYIGSIKDNLRLSFTSPNSFALTKVGSCNKSINQLEKEVEACIDSSISELDRETALRFIFDMTCLAHIDGNMSSEEEEYIELFSAKSGVHYDKFEINVAAKAYLSCFSTIIVQNISEYKKESTNNNISNNSINSGVITANIISKAYTEAREYMQNEGKEIIAETVKQYRTLPYIEQGNGYVAETASEVMNNVKEKIAQTGNKWKRDTAQNSPGGIGQEDLQKTDSSGNHIVGYELKYSGNGGAHSLELYLKKSYKEKLMVPDDQLADARKRLLDIKEGRTRITDPDKLAKAQKMRADDIQGMGVTSKEIEAFRKDPCGVSDQVAKRLHKAEIVDVVKKGALVGAVIGGTISAATNIRAVYVGEKEIGEAALDTGIDAGKAAIKTAVLSAASKEVAHQASRAGIKCLAKNNVATAVVIGSVETVCVVKEYFDGEVDGGEAVKKVGGVAVSTAAATQGAAIGATIGSVVPGVGNVVGGVVGGTVAAVASGELYMKVCEQPVETTSKMAGGALTGAAIGSFVPVVGTAVGAAVGGLLAGIFG